MKGRSGLTLALALCAAPVAADEVPRALLADEPPYFPGTSYQPQAPAGPAAGHRRGHGTRPYHPAPGIIVDVLDWQGNVIAGLQRAARNFGYWPFRRCYEEGLRRNQELTGTVSVDLRVLPEGAAARTELTGTTLKDEVVAKCVAREAHHLRLEPGEAPVLAKVRVLLALGDEAVPRPYSVPRAEALRAALRDSWADVGRCYEGALTRHPDAGGRMELRFDVTTDGRLGDVTESGTHFADPEATRCVLDVYRAAALPAFPHELQGKWFVYPVHLEPGPAVISTE